MSKSKLREVKEIIKKKIKFHCPKRGWVEEEVEVKIFNEEKASDTTFGGIKKSTD